MKFGVRAELSFFSSFVLLLLVITPPLAQCSNPDNEEEVHRSQFPDGFFFGTSTSAYQVEGAYLEDGKGLNNWDVFSHVPGFVRNNENGDIADDHYHRYLEDIELIHSLGVNAYRFSISWARILPRGKDGDVNPKGIMFYNKIIDNLLLRGIEPFVTICHLDLPLILEERYRAWLNPLIREEFVHFATICFKEFGDRVKYWITHNEPNHLADFGYTRGIYPPARCSPPFGNCSAGDSDTEPLVVMHNLLISHATAADIYRNHFQLKQGGFIGIVVHAFMYEPLRDEEVDRQAVNRALAFDVAWALDPLVHGDYPREMQLCKGLELPRFTPREKELLKGSLDFIGINHYSTLYAKDCIHSPCSAVYDRPIRGFVEVTGVRDGVSIGQPTGMERFFVVPRGMEKIIDYIKQRYNNKPMIVTENGFSAAKQQNEQVEDLLHDLDRVKYHKAYLSALANAFRNGANLRGYFIWSLMDNFEWAEGYDAKFGLYYVDRTTLNRTPKLSSKWFTSFLTNHTTNVIFINGSEVKEAEILDAHNYFLGKFCQTGLPVQFCKMNLPKHDEVMKLIDEHGSEYPTCTTSVSKSSITHGSRQLSNSYLGLPLEYGRCESCSTSEAGNCEDQQLSITIYHPSHVSELKRMFKSIVLEVLENEKEQGSVELSPVGISTALFNQVSRIAINPLVNVTTSFVAEEVSIGRVSPGIFLFLNFVIYLYNSVLTS